MQDHTVSTPTTVYVLTGCFLYYKSVLSPKNYDVIEHLTPHKLTRFVVWQSTKKNPAEKRLMSTVNIKIGV